MYEQDERMNELLKEDEDDDDEESEDNEESEDDPAVKKKKGLSKLTHIMSTLKSKKILYL